MNWLLAAAFWLLLGVVVGIVVGTYLRARDDVGEQGQQRIEFGPDGIQMFRSDGELAFGDRWTNEHIDWDEARRQAAIRERRGPFNWRTDGDL